jgi:type IV pilus assembly protein PilB
MPERRTIGQILMSLGRISEEDVGRALEYQRDHGGYFGEALLACGIVTQAELEWGLASQFDLPYVFPDADSIDMEAASLVSPEWALAHLTLPIMKTDDTLTVVVESPIRTSAVDELQARTDLKIDLALASAANIREVIRQVYARGAAAEEGGRPTPVRLVEAFELVTEAGSARFGISTRGRRSWIWWDESGTIHRRPLEGLWESELEQLMDPPPADRIGASLQARWEATINREGIVTSVDVRYLGDESGHEYLFRPIQERSVLQERFPPPAQGILSEIRMLARSGSARFVVTSEPAALGHEILAHLPVLLLDSSWRSIYINAQDQAAAEEAFSLQMPTDPDQWAAELDTLRAFHFDVVTVDLTGNQADWASSALDVASVAFLLWPMADDLRPAYDAGIRWELHIAAAEGNRLEWSLEPLHA